jgi:tetratricopeptide (TPR) repeat protein
LSALGKLEEAIAEYRIAIELKPDYAEAHCDLGHALSASGDKHGAIAAYREAIRVRPDFAGAHYKLAVALQGSGDVRGAIAAYREAIRLKPDYAEAHCNLGFVLRGQGQYAESLAELRVGHGLGSKRPDWRYPSAAWVAEAERLAAVLAGTARPADAAEGLAFAQTAYDTKRYAGAARFWSEALAADPKLSDDRGAQHRYNAACAAALAATGRAEGEPPPDAAAKAELRRKAQEWLRAELAAWSKVLDSGDPKARAAVAPTLRHWKEDSDLAGVRDGDALAKLPADERRAWEALWKDVDALLKGEARPGPAGSEPSGTSAARPGEVPATDREGKTQPPIEHGLNEYGLESAKPDLQSVFKKPGCVVAEL